MWIDLFLIGSHPWFPPVVIVLVSDLLLSICFPSQNFCLYLVCNLPLVHSVAPLSYNFAFILIQIGVWGRDEYLWSRHCVLSRSVVSHSFATPGTVASRLLCPWDSPSEKTGVDCHFLLQGSSWLRGQTRASCIPFIGRPILYHCPTWEACVNSLTGGLPREQIEQVCGVNIHIRTTLLKCWNRGNPALEFQATMFNWKCPLFVSYYINFL